MHPINLARAISAVVTDFADAEPTRELDITAVEFDEQNPDWVVMRAVTKGRALSFRRVYVVHVGDFRCTTYEIIGMSDDTTAAQDIAYIQHGIRTGNRQQVRG